MGTEKHKKVMNIGIGIIQIDPLFISVWQVNCEHPISNRDYFLTSIKSAITATLMFQIRVVIQFQNCLLS